MPGEMAMIDARFGGGAANESEDASGSSCGMNAPGANAMIDIRLEDMSKKSGDILP